MTASWLTDHRKSDLLRRFSAHRLLLWTLAVAGATVLIQLGLIVWALINPDASPRLGVLPALLMAPVVCFQFLRLYLINRGWPGVCCHELAAGIDRVFALPGGAEGPAPRSALPHDVQVRLARHVIEHGWISWAQVRREVDLPASDLPLWMIAGAVHTPVAGVADWADVFDPVLWRQVLLEQRLPAVSTTPAPRPRL